MNFIAPCFIGNITFFFKPAYEINVSPYLYYSLYLLF